MRTSLNAKTRFHGFLRLGAKDIILEEDRGTLSGIRTSLNAKTRFHGFLRLGAKDSNLYWLIQSQLSCR